MVRSMPLVLNWIATGVSRTFTVSLTAPTCNFTLTVMSPRFCTRIFSCSEAAESRRLGDQLVRARHDQVKQIVPVIVGWLDGRHARIDILKTHGGAGNGGVRGV